MQKLNTKETKLPVNKWANELNRHFSKLKKKNKTWPISVHCPQTSGKCKLKLFFRYPLTPVGMALINKSDDKCWEGCGEKGTVSHCWWECKLKYRHCRISLVTTQKVKTRITI